MKPQDVAKEVIALLKEYYHYKYMTAGFFEGLFTHNVGMSFYDFIKWLESRE